MLKNFFLSHEYLGSKTELKMNIPAPTTTASYFVSLFIWENLLSPAIFDSTIAFATQSRTLREGRALMGVARIIRTILTSRYVANSKFDR